MRPNWQGAISFDFKEENRMNRMDRLDQVLANEKMVQDELWAGTNPSRRIRMVFFVKGKCNSCFLRFFPCRLKIFSPRR